MYSCNYISDFPESLRRARKLKKYTQLQLAELLNQYTGNNSDAESTRTRISKWERGIKVEIVNLKEFLALCDILEVEADYLLGKINTPFKSTTDVMGVTGLSEKATDALIGARILGHDFVLDLINDLIESDEVYILATQYSEYKMLTQSELDDKETSDPIMNAAKQKVFYDRSGSLEYKFSVAWHDFLKAMVKKMKGDGKTKRKQRR